MEKHKNGEQNRVNSNPYSLDSFYRHELKNALQENRIDFHFQLVIYTRKKQKENGELKQWKWTRKKKNKKISFISQSRDPTKGGEM